MRSNQKIKLASISQGTLAISVLAKEPYMVTVRTDEVMALISAALDYHKDAFPQKKGEASARQ